MSQSSLVRYSYNAFFQALRQGQLVGFRSVLDVRLGEAG